MSNSPVLELDGIAKSFGQVSILADVSFSLGRSESVGVVGPNGAGKSTMLSVVTGVERATAGRVLFEGVDIARDPTARRSRAGIARSFQIPRPFKDLTVFENALVGAQRGGGMRGRPAHLAAGDAIEMSGMAHLANQVAGSLSLLDRKRLELARALATQPRLLLLDEIAGGLTDAETDVLVETILSLKRSGMTMVWIEHVVHALTRVVDRLLCLASGTVLADGDPATVLASPVVREVYLGSAV